MDVMEMSLCSLHGPRKPCSCAPSADTLDVLLSCTPPPSVQALWQFESDASHLNKLKKGEGTHGLCQCSLAVEGDGGYSMEGSWLLTLGLREE